MPELTLTTTAGVLSGHLSWVARSLPTRPTIPVLAGVRLDITETELRLTVTDYEVWATATLDCTASGTGSWLLPGRVLADLVARMPDHQMLTLTSDGAKVRLACGTATATLMTLPVQDYPHPPPAGEPVGTVEVTDLAGALTSVARACSTDLTLLMLTGIHLTLGPEGITASATDRYRLSEAELAWQPTLGEDEDALTMLVPGATLALAARGLHGTVGLAVARAADGTAEQLTLTDQTRTLRLRLLEGDFVPTAKLLDQAQDQPMVATADVDPAALREVVETVGVLADRGTPARVSVEEGCLVVSAGAGEDTFGFDVVEADVEGTALDEGTELKIAFQVGRLAGVLADCRTDLVRVLIHAADRAVLILPQDAPAPIRHLLMPVRLS